MTRNPLRALFVLVIAAYYICSNGVLANCDSSFGPAGGTHCIRLSGYYGYQWATCRTDTYIQIKSSYKHKCKNRFTKYCYYQCMLDIYNRGYGFVFSPCKCSPDDPVSKASVPLPAWCYSPDGKNCSWYRECLSKAYPRCENDDNDYAIKFAEKFCNLYNESYNEFSSQGQRWIDAVRKCLQLKLVPLVDRFRDKTCAELKSTAFDSYASCYINPDESSLSYCDVPRLDRLKVFWTIKSSFFYAFVPGLKGLLQVMTRCQKAVWSYKYNTKVKIEKAVKETLTDQDKKTKDAIIEETKIRIKTWLEDTVSPIPIALDLLIEFDNLANGDEIARSKFAGKVLDAVAMEEDWKDKGVAWFGYAKASWKENTMSIRLVVEDRYKFEHDGNTSFSESKPVNVTTALMELSETVLKGTLKLTVDGESIKILKLDGCLDWYCEEQAFSITALKLKESNETLRKGNSPVKTDQCYAYSGPNGARRCMKLSTFTDYQWATCRRDSYLKSTSGGRHHCQNQFHTYCWYHCMLEKYEQDSGDVSSSCRCTPGEKGQAKASQKDKYTFVFVVLVAISSLLAL